MIKEGEFVSLDKNLNLYIKERDANGNLLGIMINDNRNPENKNTTLAKQGALLKSDGAPRIIMENGVRQENSLQNNRFSTLSFDKYLIDFGIVEKNSSVRNKKAKERFIWELLFASEKDGYSKEEIRKYRVEAHARIAKPLYNILFYIIASIGILASSFSRYGQTKAMLTSIGCMVVLQSMQIAIENMADRSLSYLPLIYFNVIIPIVIGIYILRNDSISTSWYKIKRETKKVFKRKAKTNVA